jgi:hypothetical protein
MLIEQILRSPSEYRLIGRRRQKARRATVYFEMSDEKPILNLRAVNAPQAKQKKVNLGKASTCLAIFGLLRKSLGLTADSPLFLYYKQFAIYPDTTVGEIIEHTPGIRELDIHYSISPQYG